LIFTVKSWQAFVFADDKGYDIIGKFNIIIEMGITELGVCINFLFVKTAVLSIPCSELLLLSKSSSLFLLIQFLYICCIFDEIQRLMAVI